MAAHVASLRCISLIIKGLHLVRSVNSRRKHIQTASLRHVVGFPHRGLLRKLRQPARHRSHALLTSVADLPRFYLHGLRHTEGGCPSHSLSLLAASWRSQQRKRDRRCCPVFRIHVKTPSTGSLRITASSSCTACQIVGRGDVFNPQRRINGFMFFSLSVLNLEDHLGSDLASIPVVSGLHHLRACRRSLPLRFSTVTPGGIVGVSHRELPVQYSRQTRGSFKHPCPP